LDAFSFYGNLVRVILGWVRDLWMQSQWNSWFKQNKIPALAHASFAGGWPL